jgi:hypothetical protein
VVLAALFQAMEATAVQEMDAVVLDALFQAMEATALQRDRLHLLNQLDQCKLVVTLKHSVA